MMSYEAWYYVYFADGVRLVSHVYQSLGEIFRLSNVVKIIRINGEYRDKAIPVIVDTDDGPVMWVEFHPI